MSQSESGRLAVRQLSFQKLEICLCAFPDTSFDPRKRVGGALFFAKLSAPCTDMGKKLFVLRLPFLKAINLSWICLINVFTKKSKEFDKQRLAGRIESENRTRKINFFAPAPVSVQVPPNSNPRPKWK